MAFPTGTETSTTLAVYIPKIWGKKINDFGKEVTKFTPYFTDRSDELSGGGDTVYTNNVTAMSANSKSNATAVTLNQPTETQITLVVNTWSEVSFAIEDGDVVKFLKSPSIQEAYARNAGYTAAYVLEDAVAALFLSFTDSVGLSTTAIADSDVRKAIGIAESNTKEETDNGNFTFFFDTKVWWNEIVGNTIYQLKINSGANDPVTKQPMKAFYGVRVKTSNRIPYVTSTTGRVNVLAHKDAIHYAASRLPGQGNGAFRIQSNYIAQYLSTITTADIQFGVILNRATYGVRILSKVE